MKLLPTTLLTLLLSCASAIAQTPATFTIKEFTTENGLPSNGIKGLQWDETTGFLWIATEAGLVRYNGLTFKTFNKENTSLIASERMSFIRRNFRGDIYCADLPKNIIRIQNNLPQLWAKAVSETVGDATYFVTVSTRFYEAKKNFSHPAFASLVNTSLLALSDTSCLLHLAGSLFFLSLKTTEPVLIRKDVTLPFKIGSQTFVADAQGNVFEYQQQLHTFQPTSFSGAPGSNQWLKQAVVKWENGMASPLIFESGKVWRMEANGDSLSARLLMENFPPDIFINGAQYSERLNMLFIATDPKGLLVFYPKRVTSKKRSQYTKDDRNAYYPQVDLRNGNVLTNEGDVIGNAAPVSPMPIKGKFNYNVYLQHDTLLWYTQHDTASGKNFLKNYSYVSGTGKVFRNVNYADAMVEVDGRLYTTSQSGIGVLDADTVRMLRHFTSHEGKTLFFQSLEIEPGIITTASCNGLLRYNIATNRIDTLFAKENYCIRALWKYGDYLFFGSYGAGFYLYKKGRIVQMPLDRNKYLLYTHCFVPDGKGFVYMSTNRGLFKVDLQQLLRAFANKNAPVFYYYFGKNDGMEMTEMNGGCAPCGLQLTNAVLSFPTMDGLLWVDPQKAHAVFAAEGIFIDELLVNDKYYNPDSIALESLPAHTNTISIKLAVPAWGNKENILMEYKLNNTGSWLPIDAERGLNIDLVGLPPGNYNLVIRKLNGFGANDYSYKEMSFSIITPIYKRWWFVLLVICLFGGVLYLLYKLRVRQYKLKQKRLEQQVAEKTKELQQQNQVLEKNNLIKTRLISIISHDIVTPLKFVTVAGNELLAKKERMPEQLQQETIQEMTTTAQELQLLSTNILNWIKYQNENRRMVKERFYVQDLVRQVCSILNSLARQKGLEIKNEVDADLQITQFFEPLKIMVYNLITNAIHFTSQGSITITSMRTGNHLMLSVADTGSGMTADQIRNILEDKFLISAANVDNKKGHGLGYLIIKDLLKMMAANIKIDSEPGKGTTVYIVLEG